jgi:hypothetical protein
MTAHHFSDVSKELKKKKNAKSNKVGGGGLRESGDFQVPRT